MSEKCERCAGLAAALPDPGRTVGYRTSLAGESRTWHVREDGGVECIHAAPACCEPCADADERIARHFGTYDDSDLLRLAD